MNLEEYKTMMMFMALTSSEDLSNFKYIAADDDGVIYVYIHKPRVMEDSMGGTWEVSYGRFPESSHHDIGILSPHKEWNKTLMKL